MMRQHPSPARRGPRAQLPLHHGRPLSPGRSSSAHLPAGAGRPRAVRQLRCADAVGDLAPALRHVWPHRPVLWGCAARV